MSRWPVVTPPKPPLHTSLAGPLGSPRETFNGPLNVLIHLQGTAQGAVEINKTKEAYDAIPAATTLVGPRAADDERRNTG
ncbi:hypothetical protein QIH85_23985 [Bradyrhizobium japonicum]|uniref:hypothetical protein n=1 Tax=Bradyrhizobium japonicum TaxID=375 RepID=UPI002714939B|nr:hypothetical protein [Bradyrhizobium japonicum]WLB24944.1 hypothetical protein QIH85_23985 [Bradyrhizobium japonicum]